MIGHTLAALQITILRVFLHTFHGLLVYLDNVLHLTLFHFILQYLILYNTESLPLKNT